MKNGILATEIGLQLPLQVLKSERGFFIGTCDAEGPVSRESVEYFSSYQKAQEALDNELWIQRT